MEHLFVQVIAVFWVAGWLLGVVAAIYTAILDKGAPILFRIVQPIVAMTVGAMFGPLMGWLIIRDFLNERKAKRAGC